MHNFSRRTVLSGTAGGALLAALPMKPAFADRSSNMSTILSNTLDIYGGTKDSNALDSVAPKLKAIDKSAHKHISALEAAGSDELFSGLKLGDNDVNLASSYSNLYQIALATRVPRPSDSSDLTENKKVQDKVIDGLIWLYTHYFEDQSKGYYGNWYNWEIDIPKSVSLTLVLLNDRVTVRHPKLPKQYIRALDGYLRNGKDGDVDLDSRFHTGANLADITTNRILQGAVIEDDERVTKAVSDQMTVFETVDPYHLQHGVKDGYYADGSFIQHDSVAYTGAYGKVLLSRVMDTIKLLDGTDYFSQTDLINTIDGWLRNGFAPLIFEGWLMELVRGRQVSSKTSGYAATVDVIENTTDLAAYSSGDAATELKSYVKYLISESNSKPEPEEFTSPVTLMRYSEINEDDGIKKADLNSSGRSVAFNAMDVHVHRRPGYAFALSRSSERVSKYEYMSGQNLQPWFQGDGAHYLYLSDQDQRLSYGVNYYTDVSPYRLAGVISPVEKRKTIPELYGKDWYENPDSSLRFTSSSESQNKYVYFPRGTNKFSGGTVLGNYGIAGMVKSDTVSYRDKQKGVLPGDFVVYRNAESTTTWVMLDDEIVVLTAGIKDTDARDVIANLDSRVADPDDRVSILGGLRNGRQWGGTGTRSDLEWLQYHNLEQAATVGYVFLDHQKVDVAHSEVSQSLKTVSETNPDKKVRKKVFNLSVTYPKGDTRPGRIAYALVPNASVKQLKDYHHGHGPLEVLSNTTKLQAVHHRELGVTALNAFSTARIQRISVVGSASVVMKESSGSVSIAVSDPTMEQDRVDLDLGIPGLRPRHVDDGVLISTGTRNTRIRVNTRHTYGHSFTASFKRE